MSSMTNLTAKQVAEYLTQPNAEDIATAYLETGITASEDPQDIAKEIEEAYIGQFSDDKTFAQEMAEEVPSWNNGEAKEWPHYCIDWEYAARELMMDYTEQNGHYFRNL